MNKKTTEKTDFIMEHSYLAKRKSPNSINLFQILHHIGMGIVAPVEYCLFARQKGILRRWGWGVIQWCAQRTGDPIGKIKITQFPNIVYPVKTSSIFRFSPPLKWGQDQPGMNPLSPGDPWQAHKLPLQYVFKKYFLLYQIMCFIFPLALQFVHNCQRVRD